MSFENLIYKILDSTLVQALIYINRKTYRNVIIQTDVIKELERMAVVKSAEYAHTHMAKAIMFEKKGPFWGYACRLCKVPGLVAEFGVYKGISVNFIAKHFNKQTVYGFDSFEGLKEDWAGSRFIKGSISAGGELPKVVENVKLIKGWFDETLPTFLNDHDEAFAFIHIDSDTYEAAKTVLGLADSRIKVGTVIIFDEYFGYRGWELNEFKAFQEYVLASKIKYEYLGFSICSVAVKIVDRE